jgi:hypothetical protein
MSFLTVGSIPGRVSRDHWILGNVLTGIGGKPARSAIFNEAHGR